MDMLLQILECFAKDELYFDSDYEIEQLEQVIASDFENQEKPTLNKEFVTHHPTIKRSIQKALRMSIFTIDEEEDFSDKEWVTLNSNLLCK